MYEYKIYFPYKIYPDLLETQYILEGVYCSTKRSYVEVTTGKKNMI